MSHDLSRKHQALLAYLKSGGWGGYPQSKPITLGPTTFASHYEARQYVRRTMACRPAGQEITGEDAAILAELVKRYPYYKTVIEPYGILGFTVKDHCGSKILVVILGTVIGRHPRTRLMTRDVSIDRCLSIKRVFRQHSNNEAA
jgi:hypothetical protein